MLRALIRGKYQHKGFLISLPLWFYSVYVLFPMNKEQSKCDFIAFYCTCTETSLMSNITWEFKIYHLYYGIKPRKFVKCMLELKQKDLLGWKCFSNQRRRNNLFQGFSISGFQG